MSFTREKPGLREKGGRTGWTSTELEPNGSRLPAPPCLVAIPMRRLAPRNVSLPEIPTSGFSLCCPSLIPPPLLRAPCPPLWYYDACTQKCQAFPVPYVHGSFAIFPRCPQLRDVTPGYAKRIYRLNKQVSQDKRLSPMLFSLFLASFVMLPLL